MDDGKLKPKGNPFTKEQLAQLSQITIADVVKALKESDRSLRPYLESTRDR